MRRFGVLFVVLGLAMAGCSSGGATTSNQGGPTSPPGGGTSSPTNETPTGGVLQLDFNGTKVTMGNGSCSVGAGGPRSLAGFGDYIKGLRDETDKDWFAIDVYPNHGVGLASGQMGGHKFRMRQGASGEPPDDTNKHIGSFSGSDSVRSVPVSGDFTCPAGEEPAYAAATPSSTPTPFVRSTSLPGAGRTQQGVMIMLAGGVGIPGTSLAQFGYVNGKVLLLNTKTHQIGGRADINGDSFIFDSVTGPKPGDYIVLINLEPATVVMFRDGCYDIGVPAGWGLYYLDGSRYVRASGVVSYRGLQKYLFPDAHGAMPIQMPPVYVGSDPVSLNYLDTVERYLSMTCEPSPY